MLEQEIPMKWVAVIFSTLAASMVFSWWYIMTPSTRLASAPSVRTELIVTRFGKGDAAVTPDMALPFCEWIVKWAKVQLLRDGRVGTDCKYDFETDHRRAFIAGTLYNSDGEPKIYIGTIRHDSDNDWRNFKNWYVPDDPMSLVVEN
jgi:hypothetical protein